jgi:hypothetical protein
MIPGNCHQTATRTDRVLRPQPAAGLVVAAALAASEPEPAARVGVAGPAPAQVDDRGEVLLLPQRGGGDAVAPKAARGTFSRLRRA